MGFMLFLNQRRTLKHNILKVTRAKVKYKIVTKALLDIRLEMSFENSTITYHQR